MGSQAAIKIRELAESKVSKKDAAFKEMEDQLFNTINDSANEGLFGTCVTIKIPSENQDLVASFVGELRHGGLKVDVLSFSSEDYDTVFSFTLLITW